LFVIPAGNLLLPLPLLVVAPLFVIPEGNLLLPLPLLVVALCLSFPKGICCCRCPVGCHPPTKSASIPHTHPEKPPVSPTKPALIPLLLLLAFPTLAQSPQPAPTAPTIHVYSRETIVDVLVTDDKGQPVRGLTHSDFTVEEDGHPQPIRSFSEYDKTTPPPPPRTLPPNTYTNSTALPASGPVQIFLFDLLGTRPADMERAKKYIADYLRSMPVGTQVALFAFSPSKDLRLLQGFTTDGPAAAAVVDKLDVEWLRNPTYGTPIAIAGFNQIAAYVAGIHGRKNLVWIVPGMPLMIDRDGGYTVPTGINPPGSPDMTVARRLKDLYDLFTLEQIAIYPLDPHGVHRIDNPAALQAAEVAEATGGAIDNTNDYKGEIARVVDQTSHAYTLSYVPTRPDQDGHFHPIKITVDRPGVHLSYRTGYNDEQVAPPDPALIHDMTQGPMRLGAIPATQILFDLHTQPSAASSASSISEPSTSTAISSPPAARPSSSPSPPRSTTGSTASRSISPSPSTSRTANLPSAPEYSTPPPAKPAPSKSP
jgi:VWFA-related protein